MSDVQLPTGWGDAAQVITDLAVREAADLVVLERRGRGRLTGLLIGSVSQKLVRLALCTAVVVPQRCKPRVGRYGAKILRSICRSIGFCRMGTSLNRPSIVSAS